MHSSTRSGGNPFPHLLREMPALPVPVGRQDIDSCQRRSEKGFSHQQSPDSCPLIPVPLMPNLVSSVPGKTNVRIGIVVSRWNESITSRLLDEAVETLARRDVPDQAIDVAYVPGAWEIPVEWRTSWR